MENALVSEVNIIARDYSPSRSNKAKWRAFRRPAIPPPVYTIDYQPTNEDDMMALIFQKQLSVIDGYLFTQLYKRLMLKRNENLFKSFLSFWNLINPNRMPGISRKVYISIYEIIYLEILNASTEDISAKSMAKIDMKVDFGDSECLGLADFYDGLFECLDTFTRSCLSVEYVRLMKTIHGSLIKSQWFSQINLTGKLHYREGTKPQYSAWMVQYLKPEEIPYQALNVPSMFKAPIGNIKVSERLLKGNLYTRDKSTDILSKKIDMLINSKEKRTLRSSCKSRTSGYFYGSSGMKKKRRSNSIETDHLDVVSPLSITIKKSRRNSLLLEEIIEGRKNYFKRVSSHSQLND